jgi:thiamine-phosphate pyrophosphorylase
VTAVSGPADRWSLDRRRLYLCTPDRPDLERFLDACITAGVDVVQLRDKQLGDREVTERSAVAQKVCAHHGVPFVLNDRPDLAAALGADGVHVGQDDDPAVAAREVVGTGAIVGLSTHAPEELAAAIEGRAPVDYVSAGPVVATPTKPGRPGTGLGYVSQAVAMSPWPVWITGGVDPTSVGALITAGASHFVVVRWLTDADDPGRHTRLLRAAIEEGLDRAQGS